MDDVDGLDLLRRAGIISYQGGKEECQEERPLSDIIRRRPEPARDTALFKDGQQPGLGMFPPVGQLSPAGTQFRPEIAGGGCTLEGTVGSLTGKFSGQPISGREEERVSKQPVCSRDGSEGLDGFYTGKDDGPVLCLCSQTKFRRKADRLDGWWSFVMIW